MRIMKQMLVIAVICLAAAVLLSGGCKKRAKNRPPKGRHTSAEIETALTNKAISTAEER